MHAIDLIATLFIALWLLHVLSISAQLKSLTIDYREIRKVKKTIGAKNGYPTLFSQESLEIQRQHQEEHGIRYDHRTKRYTIDKDEWDRLQAEHVLPPVHSKFFPEYGVLFNDHGYLLPGQKKTYLFVAVEILKEHHIQRVRLDLPDCDEWAGQNLHNWQGTQCNIPAIKELIHQKVCADVNTHLRELKVDIDMKNGEI